MRRMRRGPCWPIPCDAPADHGIGHSRPIGLVDNLGMRAVEFLGTRGCRGYPADAAPSLAADQEAALSTRRHSRRSGGSRRESRGCHGAKERRALVGTIFRPV